VQHKNLWFLAVTLVVVALDQASKWWVYTNLGENGQGISVIPGLFDIVHAQNPGAALGFLRDFEHRQWLFIGFTIIAVGIIGNMQRQLEASLRFLPSVLGLILGGAIGNGIDRVHKQTVTDFLRFYTDNPTWKARLIDWFGTNEYPSFNVADIALVVGVGLFVVHYLFLDEGEFDVKKGDKVGKGASDAPSGDPTGIERSQA